MRSNVFVRSGVAILLAASSISFVHCAFAQGNQAPADMGPRAVARVTVRQVLAHGRNEQVVQLRGRIVSHDGGHNYTFRDDTGSLPVYIARAQLPGKQTIAAGKRVELVGRVRKVMRHKLEFRVSQVRLI